MTLQCGIIGPLLSLNPFKLDHIHMHSTAELCQPTNNYTIKK